MIAARTTEEFDPGPVAQRPLFLERLAPGTTKYVITAQQQLFERIDARYPAEKILRNLIARIGIVEEYAVSLSLRQIGQRAADTAEPDNSNSLAAEHLPVQELRL